jgi:glyoxylase-like metal-dependent hydrolase (beta-lactamase superfamily II)
MKQAFICTTCGVQFPPSEAPPAACPVSQDEREFIGWEGQRWTTNTDLAAAGAWNSIEELEPGLFAVLTHPQSAIGQRALLVQTPHGNLLWDCLSFLDESTIVRLQALGGIQAIAISHPHFYGSMVSWSRAFGECPIYVHVADRQWVQYHSPSIHFWEGQRAEILPGLTLLNTGGHFEGSTVLHWPMGAGGRGVLLSGDSIAVVMDRRYVSFMYSYPNLIPLSAEAVRRIVETVRPYRYECVYGAFNGQTVGKAGADAVARSAERYLRHLGA